MTWTVSATGGLTSARWDEVRALTLVTVIERHPEEEL
jgi:predicted MarR family transcription regulator